MTACSGMVRVQVPISMGSLSATWARMRMWTGAVASAMVGYQSRRVMVGVPWELRAPADLLQWTHSGPVHSVRSSV